MRTGSCPRILTVRIILLAVPALLLLLLLLSQELPGKTLGLLLSFHGNKMSPCEARVQTSTTSSPRPNPDPSKEKGKKQLPQVKSDLKAVKEKHNADYDSVKKYNSDFVPHLTSEVYTEGFLLDNKEVCQRKESEKILLLIVVISAPAHFSQREAIRRSWGEASQYQEVAFTFLVGLPEDLNTRTQIEQESRDNGDIVMNKMEDHYEGLSLKTLSAFQWLERYCPRSEFLLKVDDDMFVRVNKILDRVRTLLEEDPEPRMILGNIGRRWPPNRNPKSKYLMTEAEYPHRKYPDFASGPSYLVSRRAALEVLEAAMTHKYIHLEDVFLTGIIPDSLHIPRVHLPEFKNHPGGKLSLKVLECTIDKVFTIHQVPPELQLKLHSMARSPHCRRSHSKSSIKLKPKKVYSQ